MFIFTNSKHTKIHTKGFPNIQRFTQKDTKVSRTTHPPASTNHGRFGLIFDQSKLLTSMLQKKTLRKESFNNINLALKNLHVLQTKNYCNEISSLPKMCIFK